MSQLQTVDEIAEQVNVAAIIKIKQIDVNKAKRRNRLVIHTLITWVSATVMLEVFGYIGVVTRM